jgi:hypothetical protein
MLGMLRMRCSADRLGADSVKLTLRCPRLHYRLLTLCPGAY